MGKDLGLQPCVTRVAQISTNQKFDPEDNCVAISFINRGSCGVSVDESALFFKDQFKVVVLPQGYKMIKKWDILFDATNLGSRLLEITIVTAV